MAVDARTVSHVEPQVVKLAVDVWRRSEREGFVALVNLQLAVFVFKCPLKNITVDIVRQFAKQ